MDVISSSILDMKLEDKIIEQLQAPLPEWAVKPHPTKTGMSAIHPMAVIDRLNEVFGVGGWKWETEYIQCHPWTQKTKNGERAMYMSAVKGILSIESYQIHIEQFGGSSNDDMGDALKGGSTDALTKCASYLGIGASIYKGQGNVEPPKDWTLDEALEHVFKATSEKELTKLYRELPAHWQKDNEVIAKCKEMKEHIQEIINQ